jgi:hypothetical protein
MSKIFVGLFAGLVALIAIAIVYLLFFGECANAPKFVPFHEGMTLCPGQSAILPGSRVEWH